MQGLTQSTAIVSGSIVLGLGCERGTPAREVIGLALSVLKTVQTESSGVSFIASLDTRADEPALLAAAAYFGVPFLVYDAATLEMLTPHLANPSDLVFAHAGCHGVAEAAALAGAGPSGRLIVEKTKSAHATAAIAVGCRERGAF